MNVMVINGSPKGERSNTWKLTSAFLEGLESENVQIFDLSKMKISKCLGCFQCWNKHPGVCCIQDDMTQILECMKNVDVVIWSFPLYFFHVPGPLKNMIDRQLPMSMPFMEKNTTSGGHASRYDLSHQRHVLISTCGFYTTEGNYDSVCLMFDHFLHSYETIFCSQGELFRVPELKSRCDEYLNNVRKAGNEFKMGKISEETKKDLHELLFSREIFEAMADASWGIEKSSGEKVDESLIFTKQMAALYNRSSYQNHDIVLEMHYTDLEKRYQIILGKEKAEVIDKDFKEASTIIHTSFTLWQEIAQGKIKGDEALMKQMYRVDGDLDLMIHWSHYFGSDSNKDATIPSKGKTNLQNVLIPWILFWALSPSQKPAWILIGLLIHEILSDKDEKIIYDKLSKYAVILLSIGLFLDMSLTWLLPLSYLCFGLLWSLSCLTKIPLTAHYSMNDYGGKGMLENPIFLKTNQILTLLWGVFYLLTSIWTFAFHMSPFFSIITILNATCPVVLGVFTIWFQKWYPKKMMRG